MYIIRVVKDVTDMHGPSVTWCPSLTRETLRTLQCIASETHTIDMRITFHLDFVVYVVQDIKERHSSLICYINVYFITWYMSNCGYIYIGLKYISTSLRMEMFVPTRPVSRCCGASGQPWRYLPDEVPACSLTHTYTTFVITRTDSLTHDLSVHFLCPCF